MKINYLLAAFLLFTSLPASADKAIDNIRDMLAKRFPNVVIHSVERTDMPGLIQVVAGSQVVYFDEAGKYMLDGSLVELDSRRNITEEALGKVRLTAINKLPEAEMLVYQPKKVDHTVTVFTDIDCPYCRKLHNEMDDYMANNIKVRYVFLPFKGPRSYKTSVSVWCSEDKNTALDIAKAGGEIEEENCPHPISKHESIARELGIRGTPAIMLEDGTLLPGYVPINKLVTSLKSISS